MKRFLRAGSFVTLIAALLLAPAAAKAQSISSFAISPVSVTGATQATGTVTLAAALTKATTVKFTSSNAALPAPASINIAAGATTGTVTLSPIAVAVDTNVNVTATAGTSSKVAVLKVLEPRVATVTLTPASVVGGTSVVGAVTIDGRAPAAGMVVSLSSSSSAAKPPATVTVPANGVRGTFTITTSSVSSVATATISARTTGTTITQVLTLNPVAIAGMTVSPKEVPALTSTTGTITFNGNTPPAGIHVGLKSAQAFATVPASLSVPGGVKTVTFPISTLRVSTTSVATISATYANKSVSATMTVDRTSDLLASAWPKFRQGVQNRGDGLGSGATGQAVGTQTILDPNLGAIVNGPGGVGYFVANRPPGPTRLEAIDANQNVLWTYNIPLWNGWSPQVDTAGNIYLATNASLTKLSTTGAAQWTVTASGVSGSLTSFSVAPAGGAYALVGSTLVAFDASGNQVWAWTPPSGTMHSPPTVTPTGNLIVSCQNDGLLYCLKPDTTILWSKYFSGDLGADQISTVEIAPNGKWYLTDVSSYFDTDGGFNMEVFPMSLFTLDTSGNVTSTISGYERPFDATQRNYVALPVFASDGSFAVFTAMDLQAAYLYTYQANGTPVASLSINPLAGYGCTLGPDGAVYTAAYVSPDNSIGTACYNFNLTPRWVSQFDSSHLPSLGPGGCMYVDGVVLNKDGSGRAKNAIESSPALSVDNNTAYVGADDGTFTAYDLSVAGQVTVKWKFATKGPIKSSPAIDASGVIYFGSGDDYLYALNPDGTKKWSFNVGSPITASPTIGFDGTIYIGNTKGLFYAFNPNGTGKWTLAPDYDSTAPGIDSATAIDSNGIVYVATAGGHLFAVAPSGTYSWRINLGTPFHSSPALGQNGNIFVGGADGNLYAVSPAGAVLWKYKTGGPIVSSPAIGSDLAIYFGSDDGNVYALNTSGSLRWQFATGGPVESSIAIDSAGTLTFGSLDSNVYNVSAAGQLNWSVALLLPVFSSPAIDANGHLLIGSNEGLFYAIN